MRQKLYPALPGSSELYGYLGDKIGLCIEKGVMAVDWHRYITPFKDKTDDGNGFAGEFWGKWFTSATLAYMYQPTHDHSRILDEAVAALLLTRGPCGRISSYTEDFGPWDIWGRKYVLLGLIAYYDATGERSILDAAAEVADNVIGIAGAGQKKLTETGLPVLEALSSCSILGPIAQLHQRTKDKRYLDFAEYLVSLWRDPNEYTGAGLRLLEHAKEGTPPIMISSQKGYEMMSCFEGVCELYRCTGKREYLDAVVSFAESVRRREVMIIGSGSSAELWCDGAYRQTGFLEQPMETCVTTTWTKLCYQLLQLTGESKWADEMEITLYNALLGAMLPDGNWWAYFSPLLGERVPSPVQVPLVQSSCCVANGPRGLLLAPAWAIMHAKDNLATYINLFNPGHYTSGPLVFDIETDYPVEDIVRIHILSAPENDHLVRIRVPAYSTRTRIQVNGKDIVCSPGRYAAIKRRWKKNDIIFARFDLAGRVVTAPGNCNAKAVVRGPIVLALDNRLVGSDEKVGNLWLKTEHMRFRTKNGWPHPYVLLGPAVTRNERQESIKLTPVDHKNKGIWMAFTVPFLRRPTHYVGHKVKELVLCDYSSAGNMYSGENLFRTWLPQPLFMETIFPKNTWKIILNKDKGL